MTHSPIELDDVTGLPKVPENMFWRVKKEPYRPYDLPGGSIYGWETRVDVQLMEKYKYTHMSKKRVFLFFYTDVPVEYEGENVIRSTSIITTDGQRFKLVEDVEKHHIVDAATRVMESYNKKIEAEKLFGDYPPLTAKEETNE